MLEIRLFGPPTIRRDEAPVTINRRKSRALLFFLADEAQAVTREVLLALFWMDTPRPQALQVLRTTLHGLNQVLGADLLVGRETVELAPGAKVDARIFAAQIAAPGNEPESLAAALALYRGPFLSGVALDDAPEAESWLANRREHYRRLYVRAAGALSRLYEARGEFSRALSVLDPVVAADPLQEDVQREQIRLLYLAGDRSAAIRRYDALRRLLDEELGVPPMAETRAVYDQIIQDKLPRSSPAALSIRPPSSPDHEPRGALPFTGRETELAALSQDFFTPRLTLIEGEAGIGKTRLAQHFLSGSQAILLSAPVHELEQAFPYQPVIAALHGLALRPDWPPIREMLQQTLPAVWLQEVARLLPELRPKTGAVPGIAGAQDEWRIWEGVRQLMACLARQQPVVLFLDDLQWADPSTLNLLGYLIRQPAPGWIAYLATARPFDLRAPLAALVFALVREGRITRLPLDRLPGETVCQIARQVSPQSSPSFGQWLLRQTEGNPYLLAETVQELRRLGVLTPRGLAEERLQSGPLVPATVYSLIQSRLSRLNEPAQRLLNVAVALGRSFDFDLAARAAGLSEERALDALDELQSAGIFQPGEKPAQYRFDHSLTMEVAYREAGEVRHRRTHRHIAEAMEALYGPGRLESLSGQVAFHFLEGNEPRRAAPYALRAARQAENLAAWQEAIFFLQGALEGGSGWERYPLLVELGSAKLGAGLASQASEMFREALLLAESTQHELEAAQARLLLAGSLLPQARFSECIAAIRPLTGMAGASMLCDAELMWGTALSLEGSDLAGAEDHLRRAAEACGAGASAEQQANVAFELGSVAAQRGDLPLAIRQYHAALDAAGSLTSPLGIQRRVLANNNLAYHLLLLGDESAEAYAQAGLALAEQYGLLGLQPYLYSTLGEIDLGKRRFEQAGKHFQMGLDLANQMHMPERIAGLTANLGLLAAAENKKDLAIHRLSAAMSQADALGTRHLAAQIRLWLAPMLPRAEGQALLRDARAIAEPGGRQRLLEEIHRAMEE